MPGSPLERGWASTSGGTQQGACLPAPVTPDPAAGLLGCCFPCPALGGLGAKSGPRSRGSTPERTGHFSQVPALEKGSPRTEGGALVGGGAADQGLRPSRGRSQAALAEPVTMRSKGARGQDHSLEPAAAGH